VTAYARARSLHLERWLLSRCEPIDLKPRVYHEGRVVVGESPEVERLRERGGILFADELNRATREVEGAALDLFDNPPADVAIVSACNPPSRGQAARSLEAAAANRFCHVDVASDPTAWADARVSGWRLDSSSFAEPTAEALESAMRRSAALVSTFIRAQPALLNKAPETPNEAGRPWPSSRTWEYAERLYAMCLALGPAYAGDDTCEGVAMKLIAGCVGTGPAIEFLRFARDADLPDPENILAKPAIFKPDRARIDRTVATLTGLAACVERNFTEARWRAAWAVCAACVEVDQTDAAAMGSTLLVQVYGRVPANVREGAPSPRELMHKRVAKAFVEVSTGAMSRV